MPRKLSLSDLEKAIAARKAFLKKVIKFVFSITKERGTLMGSCNFHEVRFLNGFRNFSFLTDTGHLEFCENNLRIWYHPKKDYPEGGDKVLQLYWQTDPTQCAVNVFDQKTSWQSALLDLIKNRKRIAREEDKKIADRSVRRDGRAQERLKRVRLNNEARRLGLIEVLSR